MLPRVVSLIGSDRYLTADEAQRGVQPHPLAAAAWEVYSAHFHRFTGATLDPMFHRLAHPGSHTGSVRLDAGTGVLVVGTGPSLQPNLGGMRRLGGRVRIFTSPRGAEVLLAHGIVPDLVLVEHQTALDAHHSARHLGDATRAVLTACPLVAADWRTPAALVRGVSPRALIVPSPLPTWGLWPATAVALAIDGGAARVGLVGVDLGTAQAPDPAHAPLAALLGLLARLSPVVALDCGTDGAAKRGWITAALEDAAGVPVRGGCDLALSPALSVGDRLADARAGLAELAPVVDRARALLEVASDARGGRAAVRTPALAAGIAEMMRWRDDARVRQLVQECLGAGFLPRLWRMGVDPSLGPALWRPLMLAAHELVHQADSLARATSMTRAA